MAARNDGWSPIARTKKAVTTKGDQCISNFFRNNSHDEENHCDETESWQSTPPKLPYVHMEDRSPKGKSPRTKAPGYTMPKSPGLVRNIAEAIKASPPKKASHNTDSPLGRRKSSESLKYKSVCGNDMKHLDVIDGKQTGVEQSASFSVIDNAFSPHLVVSSDVKVKKPIPVLMTRKTLLESDNLKRDKILLSPSASIRLEETELYSKNPAETQSVAVNLKTKDIQQHKMPNDSLISNQTTSNSSTSLTPVDLKHKAMSGRRTSLQYSEDRTKEFQGSTSAFQPACVPSSHSKHQKHTDTAKKTRPFYKKQPSYSDILELAAQNVDCLQTESLICLISDNEEVDEGGSVKEKFGSYIIEQPNLMLQKSVTTISGKSSPLPVVALNKVSNKSPVRVTPEFLQQCERSLKKAKKMPAKDKQKRLAYNEKDSAQHLATKRRWGDISLKITSHRKDEFKAKLQTSPEARKRINSRRNMHASDKSNQQGTNKHISESNLTISERNRRKFQDNLQGKAARLKMENENIHSERNAKKSCQDELTPSTSVFGLFQKIGTLVNTSTNESSPSNDNFEKTDKKKSNISAAQIDIAKLKEMLGPRKVVDEDVTVKEDILEENNSDAAFNDDCYDDDPEVGDLSEQINDAKSHHEYEINDEGSDGSGGSLCKTEEESPDQIEDESEIRFDHDTTLDELNFSLDSGSENSDDDRFDEMLMCAPTALQENLQELSSRKPPGTPTLPEEEEEVTDHCAQPSTSDFVSAGERFEFKHTLDTILAEKHIREQTDCELEAMQASLKQRINEGGFAKLVDSDGENEEDRNDVNKDLLPEHKENLEKFSLHRDPIADVHPGETVFENQLIGQIFSFPDNLTLQDCGFTVSQNTLEKLLSSASPGGLPGYTDQEIVTLVCLISKVALETQLRYLAVQVDFQMCIAVLLECFRPEDWTDKTFEICQCLPLITNHHHNMVYIVQILPTNTQRGRYLKRRLSYSMLSKLLSSNNNINQISVKTSLKVNDLLQILQICKPTNDADYYELNSIVMLVDMCIGNEPLRSTEKEDLERVAQKLRSLSGDIRETVRCLYRSKVKDLLVRTASKLTFMYQGMTQRTLFSFMNKDVDLPGDGPSSSHHDNQEERNEKQTE
ncbi:uncharacterized protein LOC100370605 [Saccoglossus kowalevskii]|uniref:Uncharacterized protein LOC100370605 n=1 Tax=Saccoglossus kowalevskii TaxID=10224 RepID=A0ABM0M8U0_SACKO|nr:PREDICTED: uncharacterized protein LOC100370605 [Saccoglossus kowalevskii]